MPIENHVDEQAKMVYSTCVGKMELEDFAVYIKAVWSHGEYYGFNELFDASQADWDDFKFTDLFEVSKNASELITLDPKSKLAWITLEGKQKKLTDFYKSTKAISNKSSRQLKAFYSKDEAMEWLSKD